LIVDSNEQPDHLASMRAEFRAAQQRRYERRAIAPVNECVKAKPPPPDVEPPTVVTPPR